MAALNEGLLSGSPARSSSHTLQIESPRPLARQYSTGAKVKAMVFATLNVSIAATGTGFLSFPFAFQQAGYVLGTALCVGTSVLCAYSLVIISSCARQHNADSYQQLVKVMFGEWARQCVQWIVILFNYTGNIASLQVISSQAAPLLAVWFPHQLAGSSPSLMQCDESVPVDGDGSSGGALQSNNLCVASTMVVATIIVTPLCLLRSIESLGPTSTLGACCVLFTSVVVSLTGIDQPETDPLYAAKAVQMRLTAFQAIPIVCFATMCHFTVVPATAALRPYFAKPESVVTSASSAARSGSSLTYDGDPPPLGWRELKVLIMLCCCVMLWCNFLYVPVGVLGYRAFGSEASSNILDNFGQHSKSDHFVPESVAVLVARACMCTTTCLSYPIFTFITRMAIVDVLYSGTEDDRDRISSNMEGESLAAGLSTVKHVTITVLFLAFCAVSGVGVVWADISLGFTVSVIGATVVVAVEFFIPAAMCWQTQRPLSAVVFALVGMAVLVVGLFVTVADEVCGDSTTSFCVAVGASG